ncbi:MAG: hypothetical protein ACT4OI_11310 [Methanobacteriota archaeon]
MPVKYDEMLRCGEEVDNIHKRLAIVSLIAVALALAALGTSLVLPGRAGTTVSGESETLVGKTVSASIPMPTTVKASATASGCENAPGPKVTLTGEVAIGGLGVELIFKNNAKGTHTHTETTTATAVLIPEGESVTIPKQPVNGGTGGNPFIWLQWLDADGNAISSEIFLGRCVQGLFAVSGDFVIPSLATATVSGGSCDNRGSTITLSGELRLSGLNARLIFRNNDNPVGGPHKAEKPTTVDVVILPEGQSIEFAKQPPLGGAGGNPWISLRFLSGDGAPASEEFLLGRCVQDF